MDDRLTREQIENIRRYGTHAIPYAERTDTVIALCDLALSALRQDSYGGVDKASSDYIPLCDGHAASWFTERNHLQGGMDAVCVVCAHATPQESRQLERELVEAKFRPLGDNHHNAWACPYCRPKVDADLAGLRADAERYRWLKTVNGRLQWYWDSSLGNRHSMEVWSDDFGGLDAAIDSAREHKDELKEGK